jgi:hypothetical protein
VANARRGDAPVRQRPSTCVRGDREFHSPWRSPGDRPRAAGTQNASARARSGSATRNSAAVSKTVSGEIPPTRVRIPPPPFCCVSGHRRQMCRDIVDRSVLPERLVVAAWIERQLPDQLRHLVGEVPRRGSRPCSSKRQLGLCAMRPIKGRSSMVAVELGVYGQTSSLRRVVGSD